VPFVKPYDKMIVPKQSYNIIMTKNQGTDIVLNKVHQRGKLTFKFIDDEVGQFPVTLVKFVKKGALFVSQPYELAIWVEYLSENEGILQPWRWENLYLVKEPNGPPYLAEAEAEQGLRTVKFNCAVKAFIIC
jgi:hypothetical protein